MPMLISPSGKDLHLAPTHPNSGVEAAYRRRLIQLIDDMHASLLYWLTSAYRANTPELAQDASPANALNQAMQRLARRWQRNFDRAARAQAERFTQESMDTASYSLKESLRKKGMSVKFTMSRTANDAYQATIAENVGLIKSIASEHLSDVQGLVMRSVTQGRKLDELTDELTKRYAVTKRRAAFIARDQNNKATAVITRVRQRELGITQAKWMHSAGGKEPRPSHVAADGKLYDVDKGMLIDGEWIRPGELPNCRCVSQSVIPGFAP